MQQTPTNADLNQVVGILDEAHTLINKASALMGENMSDVDTILWNIRGNLSDLIAEIADLVE